MASRVELDSIKVVRRFGAAFAKGQYILDMQVVKDTRPFVPADTFTLADSVMNSDFGSGKLVYDTPYAHRQYYGAPDKSHDRHPLACSHWFEAAKAINRAMWLRVERKAMWL
ncbi:MAG: minor capsid protein [Coriobacteriia bacterium]|nr:minor capsid protein [Coriobacteriia bacterium]